VGEKEKDEDWAAVDADDVFRRLPVHEVKRVEAKMRADALNKQSELRSMVGTRYRDLLTSASQITALHSSSLRLSSSLKAVGAACANPNVEVPEVEGEGVSEVLPTAAHVKLLLDAPEALYSHLAHHAFLNAAMLWLLARVVKDGLNEMPEDVKGVSPRTSCLPMFISWPRLVRAHPSPMLPSCKSSGRCSSPSGHRSSRARPRPCVPASPSRSSTRPTRCSPWSSWMG
jgi:hypothetical protein